MGYNTKPSMVRQSEELLDKILTRVNSGEEMRLRVKPPANISTEQYRLRRLLAACDAHKMECGGKFAGLGQRVSLRVDNEREEIIVRPVGGVSVEEYKPNEKDAIDYLIDAKGSLVMAEFYPSPIFNREKFHSEALAIGWAVALATEDVAPDGRYTYAVERVEEGGGPAQTGFAALGGV